MGFLKKISPYWAIVYVAAAVLIGLQHYGLHADNTHNSYNNFKVFKASFGHLLAKTNLHIPYPNEYFDIFLYAPPAAVFFAPFYYLPMLPALLLWQILTALVLGRAIALLPLEKTVKQFIAWFIFIEFTTALHNFQTNSWILAFVLLTFSYYEQKKGFLAANFPMAGFFIKGFGGVGGFLLPFYPDFWKNGFSYVFWTLFFAITPAFFVGFGELPRLYSEWFNCLSIDHGVTATERMMSLMALINAFLPNMVAASTVQIAGIISLFLFLGFSFFKRKNSLILRLQVLAFLLMWVVLFNHVAESSTYIIAVCGAALWFQTVERSRLNIGLMIFVFVLTSLSVTDLFPKFIRQAYIFGYSLKVVPILFVWLKLQYEQYFLTENSENDRILD